ncbi:MAG: ABC transporter substrate-binding protein, partial [Dehalococcoidia bacterium]|nr:ABC transporter substrate-binding protein [Dehalococcoidia bacterium]
TSCTTVVELPETEPVIDDLGRPVVITGIPRRIVSLAPANTEILFALGLGSRVVGVTDYCNYPPEALEKEKVGAFYPPDIEKIIALAPDLILASDIHRHELIPALEEKGFTVFAVAPQTLDEVLDGITRVGQITGRERAATSLVSNMQDTMDYIRAETAGLEDRPRVLYLTWHDPLWTVGRNTWIDDLIDIAGGVNIFAQDFESGMVVEIEAVVARNPQVIITSMWSFEWATGEPLLTGTDAGKDGRIHQVDDDLVQRPTPRLMSALAWFAHFIHPEVFPEPDGY